MMSLKHFKTSFITPEKTPLVIEPNGRLLSFAAFLSYLQDHREELRRHIFQYGGILLRGFPIEGAEGFHRAVKELNLGHSLDYIGGDSPRDKVKEKVYTSTEAPPSFKIALHQEMSFTNQFPKNIYFYCETPPEKGGETILGDARRINTTLNAQIRQEFQERGLKYVSFYYGKSWIVDQVNKYKRAHKTWKEAFETEDRNEVEKKCSDREFKFQWHDREWLEVIQERPSEIIHPETEEQIWFNQAHLYDFNPRMIGFWNWVGTKMVYWGKNRLLHEIYYKDGKKIPRKNLYHILDVLDQCTIRFPWQKGDLLVLDNILMMHGRAPFQGKRRILTTMTR